MGGCDGGLPKSDGAKAAERGIGENFNAQELANSIGCVDGLPKGDGAKAAKLSIGENFNAQELSNSMGCDGGLPKSDGAKAAELCLSENLTAQELATSLGGDNRPPKSDGTKAAELSTGENLNAQELDNSKAAWTPPTPTAPAWCWSSPLKPAPPRTPEPELAPAKLAQTQMLEMFETAQTALEVIIANGAPRTELMAVIDSVLHTLEANDLLAEARSLRACLALSIIELPFKSD